MTSPLVLGHFLIQEPNQSTYRDEKFLLPAPASTERAAKISLLSRLRFKRSLSAKFVTRHQTKPNRLWQNAISLKTVLLRDHSFNFRDTTICSNQ